MSKLTLTMVIGATFALTACSRPAPAPEPVMAAPIMVEPEGVKSKR